MANGFTDPYRYGMLNQDLGMGYPYKNISFGDPFSFNGNPSSSPEQEPEQQQGGLDFFTAFKQFQNQPEGDSMKAYREFLQKGYPQEQPPGKLNRLGAILSGSAAGWTRPGTGYDVAQNILHEPYKRQLVQYGQEGNRLAAAANLEETGRQHTLQSVKAIIDDARQQQNTNSQIQRRDIQNTLDQARLGEMGLKLEDNKITGNKEIVNIKTGERKSLGQFDLSEGQKFQRDLENFGIKQDTLQTDRKELQRSGQIFSQGQQDRAFNHAEKMADINDKAIMAREKYRRENPGSIDAVEKRNSAAVKAIVAQDRDKYKNIWDESTGTFRSDVRDTKSLSEKDYNAFVDLYNIVYKDIMAPEKYKGYTINGKAVK